MHYVCIYVCGYIYSYEYTPHPPPPYLQGKEHCSSLNYLSTHLIPSLVSKAYKHAFNHVSVSLKSVGLSGPQVV